MPKWLKSLVNNFKATPKLPTIIGFSYWAFINVIFVHERTLHKVFIGHSSLKILAQYQIAALICSIVIANLIGNIIRKAKRDALYRKFIKRALIYFAVSFVLLLLVYPGLYQYDDTLVLAIADDLMPSGWQHFFSSFHSTLSAMLVPLACAPILFHCFWTALAAAYVSTFLPPALSADENKRKKLSIALFAVFFLPPMLLYTLSGYRIAIYRLLEIFVIVYLYIHYKKQEKISTFAMISLSFIVILIASWRSEGIYYILGLPIILFAMRRPLSFTIRRIAIYSIIVALCVLNVNSYNNKIIGNNSYQMGALMVAITGIIDGAIEENDEDTLNIYSQVIDIDCVKDGGFRQMPERVFWRCITTKNPTVINTTIKETVKLAPKYLKYIIPLYADIACDAFFGLRCGPYNTGQSGVTPVSDFAIYFFSDEIEEYEPGVSFDDLIDLPLKKPFNREIRAGVANFLTGRFPDTKFVRESITDKSHTDPNAIPVYYQLFYSLIVPIILAMASIIGAIRRKKWVLLLLVLVVCARVPIVLAGSMASFLMYFMPFYLSSIILFIIIFYEDKTKKKATAKKVVAKKQK